jgi:hypothetical protein
LDLSASSRRSAFRFVARGDSIGAETLRRSLVDWLTDMSLISAGGKAETDGYVG